MGAAVLGQFNHPQMQEIGRFLDVTNRGGHESAYLNLSSAVYLATRLDRMPPSHALGEHLQAHQRWCMM